MVLAILPVINPHKLRICGLWKILWETLSVFFCQVDEDLRDCGVFATISPISHLISFTCTSSRYIAATRGILPPWFL
jgi:hypothetical protein